MDPICWIIKGEFNMTEVSHEALKHIIKESVKDVVSEELVKLRIMFFSTISDKEM